MNTEWIKPVDEMNGEETTKVSINEDLGLIAFVSAMIDHSPIDPFEDCDGLGKIFSFLQRHFNKISLEDGELYHDQYGDDVVILSYFEHGNCIWKVAGEGLENSPDFMWDGCPNAGMWIPDESCLESVIPALKHEGVDVDSLNEDELKKARREWMVKQARLACKIHTDYSNGNVYGYEVKVYKIRKTEDGENIFDDIDDYRFDEFLSDDSCFGYYGWDGVEEAMQETIASLDRLQVPS